MACSHCSPSESMAQRVDAYKSALSLLRELKDAGLLGEDQAVGPEDVFNLAIFLDGRGLGE